jgi:hypothetical protein
MTSPEQDLCGETFVSIFLAELVMRAVRRTSWDLEELTDLVNKTIHELHEIFLKKACDVGLVTLSDETVAVAPDVRQSFVCNLFGRVPDGPFKSSVYWEIFQSWKEVAKVAVESVPGEDPRYTDILALFMYAMGYDDGT